MPLVAPCASCGNPTPIQRLASVILDGAVAKVCPKCAAAEKDRIEVPYSPRADQGAIQPSTTRDAW